VAGLFKWNARKADEPAAAPAPASASPSASASGPSSPPDTLTITKVFPKFLSALAPQPAAVLVDLGPVVGSNISFFGERLPCKIYVEDLFAEVERHAKRGEREAIGAALTSHLTQADETVDAILCWDLFDFLDKHAGQVLARKLVRMLKPGGALYGFFGTSPVDLKSYSRFIVEGDDRLRVRTSPATPVRRHVLQNRDLAKMFDPLVVAESVLLKSSAREALFRKL